MSTRAQYPSLIGNQGKFLRVNPTETDAEWQSAVIGTGIQSVTGWNVDNTDPVNPVILPLQVDGVTILGTGEVGSPLQAVLPTGFVQSVNDDGNGFVTVDNTDPNNPIIDFDYLALADDQTFGEELAVNTFFIDALFTNTYYTDSMVDFLINDSTFITDITTVVGSTGAVAVDSSDTTPSYLASKLNIHSSDGSVVVVTSITNPSGNEILDIDLTTTGGSAGNQLVTMTASEDLTIGQTVGNSVMENNKVARANRINSNTVIQDYTMSGFAVIQDHQCEIGGDKFVMIDWDTTGTDTLNATIGTVNNSVMTLALGTSVAVTTTFNTTINDYSVCKLDTDKFIVFYVNDASGSVIKYRVGTVSGTVITFGTEATVDTLSGGVDSFHSTSLGTNKGVIFYAGTTPSQTKVTVFTTSGTVATFGTPHTVGTNVQANAVNDTNSTIQKIATDKFAICASSNDVYAQVFTCSGTTITAGTELQIANPATSTTIRFITSPNTDVFVLAYATPFTGITYAIACTVSTTTITAGTPLNTLIGTPSIGIFVESTTSLMCVSSSNTRGFTRISLSGTTLAIVSYINTTSQNTQTVITMGNGYWIGLYSSSTSVFIFIQGMSVSFLGIAQSTVAKGASVNVLYSGKDSNQSGLAPGGYYVPDALGGIVVNPIEDTTYAMNLLPVMKALSATEVVI